MDTIFQRLNTLLEDNDLDDSLGAQTSSLVSLASSVGDLVTNPPQGIDDLGNTLNQLSLPNFELGGDFGGTISSLQQALPSDLSSVTGVLTDGLDQLKSVVGDNLQAVLDDVLKLIEAIYQLTQIDWTCSDSGATGESGTGGDGASEEDSGGAGGGTESGTGTTPGPVSSSLDRLGQTLDALPDPLNVDTLFSYIFERLDSFPRGLLSAAQLPVIDDLRDLLSTLLNWRTAGPEAIRQELDNTLQEVAAYIRDSVRAPLEEMAAAFTALSAQLQVQELAQWAHDVQLHLEQIANAVESNGDLAPVSEDITAYGELLDQFDTLRGNFESNAQQALEDLSQGIDTIVEDLTAAMDRMQSELRPRSAIGFLDNWVCRMNQLYVPEAFGIIQNQIGVLTDRLEQLMEVLDLSIIQEPLQTAAQEARDLVDDLDDAMVGVTSQVQGLFTNVESLVDALNIEEMTQQVEQAIDDFKDELLVQLRNLFEPVRTAISTVITSLDTEIGNLDMEVIENALRDVIERIADVLENTELTQALGRIESAVDQVTQQLQSLSFAPVADLVIEGIEHISETVQEIDPAELNAILKGALKAALAVIPDNLQPYTDPLIDDLGKMIEGEGDCEAQEDPAPLCMVERVCEQPQKLMDQVREFEPAKLVGDKLSKPYQDLLDKMDAFCPTNLLEPLEQELDKFKARLAQDAKPSRALLPLTQLFDQFLAVYDQLDPQTLISPLENSLQEVIDKVMEVLPAEEIFQQFDDILNKIEQILGLGDNVLSRLDQVTDKLEDLAAIPDQFGAWLDTILSNIGNIEDSTLSGLSHAVDHVQAQALGERFTELIQPVRSALTILDGATCHTAFVHVYQRISRSIDSAVPDSDVKTELRGLLDRFDPMAPVNLAPFLSPAELGSSVDTAERALNAALADWDMRYHGADGVLAEMRHTSAGAEQVRQWIRQEAETLLLEPLGRILSIIEPVQEILSDLAQQVRDLVLNIRDKIDGLITGPYSLGGIRDAVQDLIDRLESFDLSFLSGSLEDLFLQVRGKLELVSPARMEGVLDNAFQSLLDALTLDQLLPSDDLEKLDEDYDKLIKALEEKDPKALIEKAVQPDYEDLIPPLLEPFDLTEMFDALIERMRGLDDELKAEMERVNQAYNVMLQAVDQVV